MEVEIKLNWLNIKLIFFMTFIIIVNFICSLSNTGKHAWYYHFKTRVCSLYNFMV